MATRPEPLWVDAATDDDPVAVQFTRWPKWQRTRAEVKAYLARDAERKRRARGGRPKPAEPHPSSIQPPSEPHPSSIQPPSNGRIDPHPTATRRSDNDPEPTATSDDSETSARTEGGRSQRVRADVRNPRARETDTDTKNKNVSGYLTSPPHETYARDDERPVDRAGRPAMDLTTIANGQPSPPLPAPAPENLPAIAAGEVAEVVDTALAGFDPPVLADIRRQAVELHERQGVAIETLTIALADYADEPPGGRRQLRLFIADANKKRNGHKRPTGIDAKAAGWQAMKQPTERTEP